MPVPAEKNIRAAFPAYAAAAIALLGIALLFAMIIAFALPALSRQGSGGVFSWIWQPYRGEFGILPMLCGSLILAASALCLAWPLSLMLCCWTLTVPSGQALSLVRGLIRLMTAVPTVVYGFAAVFLLAPLVRAGLVERECAGFRPD